MIKELALIFLLGASPISEVRGAIPVGFLIFEYNIFLVYFVAILGNLIMVPFALVFLKYFSNFLMRRYYFFNRLLNYIFSRTRNHHAHKFEKWEHWALLVLVAIPLPLTGAWSGSVAAFLFGIPFKKALVLISGGILIAGALVAVLTLLGAGALGAIMG